MPDITDKCMDNRTRGECCERAGNDNDFTDKCVHDDFCGGCVYQGIDYDEQLAEKENEVRELFFRENLKPKRFESIEGCPEPFRLRYRNKMEYTFGDMEKDGPLCLGMHQRGRFMSVVTVDECRLVDEDFNKILSYTLEFCKMRGYQKYHKKSHKGLLRNLIIRKGERTGEILVNIVTSSQGEEHDGDARLQDKTNHENPESGKNRERHAEQYTVSSFHSYHAPSYTRQAVFDAGEWVAGMLELPINNKIVGIMHTINDNIADAVRCDELRLLFGRDYYFEVINGLKFKVHEFAFFQTNVEAVERLYTEAIDLIPDFSGKEVFDLYCGTGTISQIAALRAGHVLGIEIVKESVDSAIENSRINRLSNCDFICGDVFEVLENSAGGTPDVIFLDPPRVGISTEAVSKIASYGVPRIVYISCNPKSLVKNLVQFRDSGYEIIYVKPFDNFPMTRHVETIVLMSKVAPTE